MKIETGVVKLLLCAVAGFYFGLNWSQAPSKIEAADYQEIALVRFSDIVGDGLSFSISGPARVIWGQDQFVENDGSYRLPLGQFAMSHDRLYEDFSYLGNLKTNKFYPTTSYPARGTEVRYRRFFETKEAALAAGFVASKLVK